MNNKIMKFATLALAAGFALSGACALAKTDRPVVEKHRSTAYLHRNTTNADGPATFRAPAKSYAVPGWSDEQTQNWIDNATGPKD
jgi:hypothetical protein